MAETGRETQVLVPVPLTWPMKPAYLDLSSPAAMPSSTATVSLRMTIFLPVMPRRSSSAIRDAPISCPSQPLTTTSLSMVMTRPSRSGVMVAA